MFCENHMYKESIVSLASSLFLILFIGLGECKTSLGAVSVIVGSAFVKHDGDTAWVKARIHMPVYENDAITTKSESECEISLNDDKVIRLSENTAAIISEKQDAGTGIRAAKGSMWINVKHLVNKRSFDVTTPTAVAAIRGTVFGVQCDQNKSDYLVFKGAVAVSAASSKGKGSGDSTFLVNSGSQFTLVKDLNLYLKQEEKDLKNYLEQSNEEFEKYKNEEQEKYDAFEKEMQEQIDKMISEERGAFKQLNNMSYAMRPIDVNKISKSEWVKWNQSRDKELNWK
jgi:FecR protein